MPDSSSSYRSSSAVSHAVKGSHAWLVIIITLRCMIPILITFGRDVVEKASSQKMRAYFSTSSS